MSKRRLGTAAAALLAVMAASATSPPRPVLKRPAAPAGTAQLMAFGGRSSAQLESGIGGKLDATLAHLARHTDLVRSGHALADLHVLNPAARFRQSSPGAEPLVAIDAVTRGDPQQLKQALLGLGLEHPAVFRNDVGGWLPVRAIEAAAARAEVHSLRAALSHTRAVVATQGDFAQGTLQLRGMSQGLDGSGVTVGVLSDSYNCYAVYAASGLPPTENNGTGYAQNGFTADAAMDVSTSALPANVTVLEEAGGQSGATGSQDCMSYYQPWLTPVADEGRAMLQIVHAVAPGASLAFYTAANSEADFANGIQALATAGAKVIADDVGYYDEPFFQDGLLSQAVDSVEGQGVAYFSAAGNNGSLAYDNAAPVFNLSGGPSGELLLDFDPSGAAKQSNLNISVPALSPGEFIAAVVEWDQPYVTGAPGSLGARSQIDLCVSVPAGSGYVVFNNINAINNPPPVAPPTCTGPNAVGADPVQVLIIGNSAQSTCSPPPTSTCGNTNPTTVSLTVGLLNGSPPPGRIKVVWEDNGAGSSITSFPTATATLQGHPGAAGAAAVGAAFFPDTPLCGTTPAALEGYSSQGGAPILFDTKGNPQAPVVRNKPDFVGPDGPNSTFFGFEIKGTQFVDNSNVAGCANDANLPNYLGTSAATPHAAGLAALMLQANSALTPAQIYSAMRTGASPMQPVPSFFTGAGFIQAAATMAQLPPGPPAISVSPATITVGQSATLSWSSLNTTSCTGSWSGTPQAASGSISVTPAAAGSDTYTLTCSNAKGSAKNLATLTVQADTSPPSSGGGGGGALGGTTLLALAGLLTRRLRRRV